MNATNMMKDETLDHESSSTLHSCAPPRHHTLVNIELLLLHSCLVNKINDISSSLLMTCQNDDDLLIQLLHRYLSRRKLNMWWYLLEDFFFDNCKLESEWKWQIESSSISAVCSTLYCWLNCTLNLQQQRNMEFRKSFTRSMRRWQVIYVSNNNASIVTAVSFCR